MKITRRGKFKLAGAVLFLILVIFSLILLISENTRRRVRIFFSPACIQYKQGTFSNRLTDRIIDYYSDARRTGIEACEDENDIKKKLADRSLVRITSGHLMVIEKMSYSYPCLTVSSRELLEEIARRFREKARKAGLNGSRFIVTSMIRTNDQMKQLRRINSNASANSPHMNGNAFDISYIRFRSRKLFITDCDRKFLKEALAEIIVELRDEDKCWATYERNQSCFHVVAR